MDAVSAGGLLDPNSTTSISCGFAVQLVVQCVVHRNHNESKQMEFGPQPGRQRQFFYKSPTTTTTTTTAAAAAAGSRLREYVQAKLKAIELDVTGGR